MPTPPLAVTGCQPTVFCLHAVRPLALAGSPVPLLGHRRRTACVAGTCGGWGGHLGFLRA